MHKQLIDKLQHISTHCFQEFGIPYDGTPSFAEPKAVKIRFFTFEYDIIEILVRVALFNKRAVF